MMSIEQVSNIVKRTNIRIDDLRKDIANAEKDRTKKEYINFLTINMAIRDYYEQCLWEMELEARKHGQVSLFDCEVNNG